ncbi:hypothetical protein B0T21DRAFT_344675 [Apiosordaria backusii]|uniref:Uncharacterized protein n=1 Tax=Apiosordaria backusii TaxID=314023 RepID=A0AA40ES83_9PEZI|nr:hypothetical protein B0T21DRAFT_344675 [Apiosordaria backusii]
MERSQRQQLVANWAAITCLVNVLNGTPSLTGGLISNKNNIVIKEFYTTRFKILNYKSLPLKLSIYNFELQVVKRRSKISESKKTITIERYAIGSSLLRTLDKNQGYLLKALKRLKGLRKLLFIAKAAM